jgi:hypothetical protein
MEDWLGIFNEASDFWEGNTDNGDLFNCCMGRNDYVEDNLDEPMSFDLSVEP